MFITNYKLQIVYFYSANSTIQQLVIKGRFTYNKLILISEIITYIHIYITYRLELFEHIGFKLALKGVIVCYASQMVGQCVP